MTTTTTSSMTLVGALVLARTILRVALDLLLSVYAALPTPLAPRALAHRDIVDALPFLAPVQALRMQRLMSMFVCSTSPLSVWCTIM